MMSNERNGDFQLGQVDTGRADVLSSVVTLTKEQTTWSSLRDAWDDFNRAEDELEG
jgi:hypothetical protein